MSATTNGDINFSLTDETALYTESVSQEINCKTLEIPSGGGEIVAAAFYGHTGTFSLQGALKTTGSPAWDIASAFTLTNSVDLEDLCDGTPTAQYIITSVSAPLGAEAAEQRNISGNIYPFLTA
jgi:hypothetical protein